MIRSIMKRIGQLVASGNLTWEVEVVSSVDGSVVMLTIVSEGSVTPRDQSNPVRLLGRLAAEHEVESVVHTSADQTPITGCTSRALGVFDGVSRSRP